MMKTLDKSVIRFCLVIVTISLLINGTAKAQGRSVTGTVIDSLSNKPLPYATVSIFSTSEKKLITGAVSDDAGNFAIDVKEGTYYAEVSFIGYNTTRTRAFTPSGSSTSIGTIMISPTEEVLQEVI